MGAALNQPVADRTAARRTPSSSQLALLAVFIVSRILYWLAGLRFDVSPLRTGWQYIDPELMKTRLLESVFYLHMQPPGFNLAIGLVVKLFPNSYSAVLQFLYLLIGLAIAFSLFSLMRRFRIPETLAAGLTCLFIVNPGCLMYENSAMYEYPIVLLLLLAAIALFRFCESGSVQWSLAFFGLLFALAMTRNIFHPLFMLLIVAALIAFRPSARRAVLMGAVPAFVLILSVVVKNGILFGAFTTSTWAGMTTGVVTTFQLNPEDAQRLVDSGVLTPIAMIPPFSPLKDYAGLVEPAPRWGIPVLDNPTAALHDNYNDLTYLRLGPLYVQNAKAVLLHHPSAYIKSVAIAWWAYFLPTSEMHSFDDVRATLQPFDHIYSAVIFGQFRHMATRKDLRALLAAAGPLPLVLYTGIFLMIALPILTVWALLQFRRQNRGRWSAPERAVLAFMIATILFSTAVSNSLSTFENNRYRFPLDGYFTVVAGLFITQRRLNRAGSR